MLDRLLYFPYIRVPNNEWFTRVLLYWDQVGSIVPYEYLGRPETLGRHMAELVSAELVKPVIPREHIGAIPRFTEAFVELVDTDPAMTARSQIPQASRATFRIHMEKLGWIADELCRRGLARQGDYPWYDVEEFTAIQFMTYLAAGLGQLPGLGYVPATDEAEYLAAFSTEHDGRTALTVLREHLRATILEGILPSPGGGVSVTDLARFKSRYSDSLRRFRRRVESLVMEVASISDTETRTQRVGLMRDELGEEVEELGARMREAGWSQVVFGTFCSLLAAAVPGALAIGTTNLPAAAGAVPGLIAAVYSAFTGSRRQREIMRSPLAYAALAQSRLA